MSSGYRLTPMLAEVRRGVPATTTGVPMAACTRARMFEQSSGELILASSRANSSPPRRARVSPVRRTVLRLLATARNRASPAL
ncbi:hypothetical protein D3C80_1286110 [compost metagenome]